MEIRASQVAQKFACQAGDMGSSPGSGSSPSKEMATCSSIFAWEIPWTGQMGGSHVMGVQRVRYDLVTKNNNKKVITRVVLPPIWAALEPMMMKK